MTSRIAFTGNPPIDDSRTRDYHMQLSEFDFTAVQDFTLDIGTNSNENSIVLRNIFVETEVY